MGRGAASSIAGLALLATVLSGCVAGHSEAVFGPEDGDGALGSAGALLPVAFKAKPARGPAPLAAEFTLDVADSAGLEVSWSIDFGNGSQGASGDRLPASASHSFTEVGSHDVTATVRMGEGATRSRLVVVVLPADAPPADPEEEVEGETLPAEDGGGEGGEGDGGAEGNGTDDGGAAGGGTSTASGPPSGTTGAPPSSTGPSPSPSQSSSPSPSASPSPSPSPNPSPTSSSTTSSPPPPSPSASSTSSTSAPPTSTAPPPSGNHPPQATIQASRTSGEAPLDVSFTIDASDPEGSPIQWTLDVRDDGSIEASGDRSDVPRTTTHRFDQPGTYVTALRVSDGVSTTTQTLTVTVT